MSEVNAAEGAETTLEKSEPMPEKFKMAPAPALRVEQIKEDGPAIGPGGSPYTSEEEGHVVGEGSDADCTPAAEKEFVPPEDELKEKIIKQVEFYFSDVNILKDAFLLKHVRRNKQGYVSLKLITSFKKVKSLTKDFRIVAYSLRQSEHLEVNEDGTKVCRKQPLPDYDETTPSRTVVAVNLPVTQPTIENVAEIFSKCGEIALVRILRPGKTLPPDIKRHSNKHPEIGVAMCAVVEFEHHEAAKKAVTTLTNKEDWRGGMRVVLLAMPKPKKEGEKKEKKNNKLDKPEAEGENVVSAGSDDGRGDEKKRRKRGGRKKNSRMEELVHKGEHSAESGGSGSEQDHTPRNQRSSLSPKTYDPNRLSPSTTPRSSPRNSPKSSPTSRRRNVKKSPLADMSPGSSPKPSPKSSPDMWRKKYDSAGSAESSPSSPWVQRRMKAAAQQGSPLAADGSPLSSPLLGRRGGNVEKTGVTRHPRGPDGTKGFYGGMGRGKPIATAE